MKPVVTEVINFCHELDLLEAHLDEHQHFIDRIVVVESEFTYSGMPKPLYFDQNKERFARFNVEHEVLPPALHVSIPAEYPESEHKHWFDERRNNRERQQTYIFNKYKTDCDYIANSDTDEIWSRDRYYRLQEKMNLGWCYIAPGVRRFFYFLDWGASNSNHWRITRSDMETHVRQKGVPRGDTMRVGWHFTSCYKNPQDMWMKYVGLAQSAGFMGWAKVPSPSECAQIIADGRLPGLPYKVKDKLEAVMPIDNLDWLPSFMRENKDLWPWLPAELREGLPIDVWHINNDKSRRDHGRP